MSNPCAVPAAMKLCHRQQGRGRINKGGIQARVDAAAGKGAQGRQLKHSRARAPMMGRMSLVSRRMMSQTSDHPR